MAYDPKSEIIVSSIFDIIVSWSHEIIYPEYDIMIQYADIF
jgi:hypothetical protein